MHHLLPLLLSCLLLLLEDSCAQTGHWQQLNSSSSPSARAFTAMSYDSSAGQLVLFGGASATSKLGDTWVLKGSVWSQVQTSTAPPATQIHGMCFDESRARLVLVEGGTTFHTWEFDGRNWQQPKPTSSPPARSWPAMAYDARRKRVVLFGGRGFIAQGALNDTWEWDGVNWTEIKPLVAPPARMLHCLAYEEVHEELVLFGGTGSAGHLGDTWTFDGTTWTHRSSMGPSRRAFAGLAKDGMGSRLLLFGGADPSGYQNDLWSWSGRAWTKLTSSLGPSVRGAMAFAYDPVGQRAVLFGGTDAKSTKWGDTWVYQDRTLPLTRDLSHVSLAGQRRQTLHLDAGNAHAQQAYLVLGSLSGTAPGIPLGPSLTLPLQPDAYLFNVTLALPNSALLQSSLGVLDATGRAQATWTAIPQLPSALIGRRFHHAFLCFGATGFTFVSNAAPVTLIQ